MLRIAALAAAAGLIAAEPEAAAGVRNNPWVAPYPDGDSKYFAFHKAGVSIEQAQADLKECAMYAASARPFEPPPDLVLLGENPTARRQIVAPPIIGGLLGNIAIGAILGGFAQKMARGDLRRCMNYKGYRRFALNKGTWEALNQGKDEDVTARLTSLASGVSPEVGALRP